MPLTPRLVHAAIAAIAAAAVAAALAAPAPAYKAKIRETSYGIPHIKADNYGSAGYGVGFAFAKQNICTFANNNVTTSARRSKFFGSDGESPASAAGPVNNLDSDFFWQSVIDSGRIEDLLKAKGVQSPSKDAKAAIRGYAAGYNAYLKKVGVDGIPDPRCRGEKWVKPIEAIDVWRRIYQADLLASAQNFISDFVAAQPPTTTTSAPEVSPGEAAEALRGSEFDVNRNDADTASMGSNALGVGSEDSQNGHGLVLANPHFPWQGIDRFWELHIQIPGELNVIGSSLMGFPAVNVGHNRHVAWSHTVSTAQRFTLFELELDPSDPTSYIYNGKSIADDQPRGHGSGQGRGHRVDDALVLAVRPDPGPSERRAQLDRHDRVRARRRQRPDPQRRHLAAAWTRRRAPRTSSRRSRSSRATRG